LKPIFLALLLFLASTRIGAQPTPGRDLPKFMGHAVTIVEPELDADGFFPKGPASVCVESVPQRQCYTAPEGIGRFPAATVVPFKKDFPTLLFSAASGGVSGWEIHFALLRSGTGKDLDDILDVTVSNQNQHAFWNDPATSDAAIFVTADFVWGPEEGHYTEHRYIISTYVFGLSREIDRYYLQDRYMTVHKYDLDTKTDILASEKPEVLARLRRVKVETERQRGTRR
jgi:hypothetical protein